MRIARLALLTAALCSCAQTGEPDGTVPLFLTGVDRPRETRPVVEADDAAANEVLEEARVLTRRGDHRAAIDLIDGALMRREFRNKSGQFHTLRLQIRSQILNKEIIHGFVRFDKPRYEIGDVIEAELILMNVSDRTVTVAAEHRVPGAGAGGEDAVGRCLVRTRIAYKEYLPTGAVFSDRRFRNYLQDTDIVLEPGQIHKKRALIGTMDINPAGIMYRTYSLEASIHAPEIRIGEDVYRGRIDLASMTAGVFPRDSEYLARDALVRMQESLVASKPFHITLAAGYLPEGDKDKAYDFIATALERPGLDEIMERSLLSCLMILSRVELPARRDEWIKWLRTRRVP